MGTTKEDLSAWFDRGVTKGATHMIIMVDTYDWEDYPVYVMPGENAREVARQKTGNMQSVMECYNLSKPKEPQLNQHRTHDYD